MDTTLITCTGLLVLMLAAWQFVRSPSGADKSIPTEWMVSIGRIANDQALGHHRDARRGALQVIHALKRSSAGSPVAHHVRIRLAGLLAKDPVYPEVVVDDGVRSMKEMISAIAATQGLALPNKEMPSWLADALARVAEGVWRAFKLKGNLQ